MDARVVSPFGTRAFIFTHPLRIAQVISVNLGRSVSAHDVCMHFSQVPVAQVLTVAGIPGTLPDALPMYPISDGMPGRKTRAASMHSRWEVLRQGQRER
jgi:hypothetical protein